MFSEYGHKPNRRVLMARDERYKYVYYTQGAYVGEDGAEELFDLREDPNEFTNLAWKPEAGEILERMRKKMLDWKVYAADPLPKKCGNVRPQWR